jgi:tetratricopeptide (TPR) repeat protein
MKKILFMVWLFAFAGSIYGQQSVDYILKAKALTETGKVDKAVDLLTGAIAVTKDNRLYIERANAYITEGNYSAAISDLNEANKLVPNSGEFALSRIYALKGDATTSLYHLEMNLNSSLKKSEKEIMLDPAFTPVESSADWRRFWKKEWYSVGENSISEIEYYISAGKTDEANNVLSELKKNYQNEDDVLYAEALIYFSTGKYPEALKSISGLIQSNPGNEKYLRILARSQVASANPAGASKTYSDLIGLGIADAELLILRADCYRKTGETAKALADIEKYLEIYPENRSAISLAGKVEAVSGDNLKAIEYYSQNLKLHPNDSQCYIDRADSYFVSKSWDLAIQDYSMSLDLKPDNSNAWLNKGISLLNQGKAEDACHDFRKSMSQGNKRASEYISRECIK